MKKPSENDQTNATVSVSTANDLISTATASKLSDLSAMVQTAQSATIARQTESKRRSATTEKSAEPNVKHLSAANLEVIVCRRNVQIFQKKN